MPVVVTALLLQDYLPDMAYEGVVTARTQLGVRVYFAHLAYVNALQESKRRAGSVTAQAPGAVAAGTATALQASTLLGYGAAGPITVWQQALQVA